MKKNVFLWLVTILFISASCGDKSEPLSEIIPKEPEKPTEPIKPVEPEVPYVPIKTYYPAKIRITTEGGKTIEKDTYVNATIVIDSCDAAGNTIKRVYNGTTEIKGRGFSTWQFLKKPYRLKLTTKTAFFDMPENRHWVLLANHVDKTLVRNEIAFDISRRMGFTYTAQSRYADVVLNGKSVGNYQLVEHMRVDPNRVNIAELKPTATNITGGYFLEIDELLGEPIWFRTEKAEMPICIKSPEDIPTNQLDYIKNHVQKVEDILYGKDGINTVSELPKYLDMKSFIDYYLLNELSKNVDGNLRRSTFLYKKQDDDKLYFGTAWDYDITFGNAHYDDGEKTAGWLARKAPWYQEFFKHPEFNKMVVDRWRELRKERITYSEINTFIEITTTKIEKSQKANFIYWDILNTKLWPSRIARGTYANEINYMKDWINKRLEWMDSQL